MRVNISSFVPAGLLTNKKRSKKLLRGLALISILILGIGVYFGFIHTTNQALKNPPKLEGTKISSEGLKKAEDKEQGLNKQKLASGEIIDYEYTQLAYVESYIDVGDYASASRVLSDISKNVPSEKLDPVFYRYSAEVAKHNGDSALYKEDMQKLIDGLKKAGRDKEADYYAKQLQGGS